MMGLRFPAAVWTLFGQTFGSVGGRLCPICGGSCRGNRCLIANHPDAVSDLASQGAAPSDRQLKMEIYLAARNQAQLDELSDQLQDPNSPQYHHWLTPSQFNQRFGPTDADVAADHSVAHRRRI